MSAEELKALLSTPAALFVLMLLASFGSAWKQMLVSRRSGTGVSVASYFLDNWPETLAMIGHNILAFVMLIFTDTLNPAAAIGLGYIANDAADAYTKEGRSFSIGPNDIAGNKQKGFARISLLVTLAVLTMLALGACQTPPHKVIEVACTPGTKYSVERCVKGIGETWEVYQIRAEVIVADPLTPADVKRGVQQAEAASRPVVRDTLLAGAEYAEIKQQVAAGTTEAERLTIANANLEAWVAKALPLVQSFGRKLGR
ncbi:MAG TPA: hypothetical protein VGD45_20730 [Steroidobacter sp.]|uniref:hypothetical protein n=1 Tax=Steroidobacter sp. TaxID=1978227 RepID=UPI002ED78CAA